MKKYDHLRKKAVELRIKKKMTLGDIANRLALNKSTVYYWVKNLKIPKTELQNNAIKAMIKAHVKKHQKLRKAAYNEGKRLAPELFKNKQFRDFVVVYLCEGYRKTRHQVAVANANYMILTLVHHFIKKFSANKLHYGIQLHVDQDENEIKKYWSKKLGINETDIKIMRKSNSGKLRKRNWRSAYGVLTVRTNDTYFRAKLQAWMDYLQDQWN